MVLNRGSVEAILYMLSGYGALRYISSIETMRGKKKKKKQESSITTRSLKV